MVLYRTVSTTSKLLCCCFCSVKFKVQHTPEAFIKPRFLRLLPQKRTAVVKTWVITPVRLIEKPFTLLTWRVRWLVSSYCSLEVQHFSVLFCCTAAKSTHNATVSPNRRELSHKCHVHIINIFSSLFTCRRFCLCFTAHRCREIHFTKTCFYLWSSAVIDPCWQLSITRWRPLLLLAARSTDWSAEEFDAGVFRPWVSVAARWLEHNEPSSRRN